MAIIYSYPEKSSPAGGDFLVITDSEQPAPNKNRTKSLSLTNLADFIVTSTSGITGFGTLDYIPKFTSSNSIGNSLVVDRGFYWEFFGGTEISGTSVTSSTLAATSTLNAQGTILDGTGGAGAAGQVLSSTGTGVAWIAGDTNTTYDLTGAISGASDYKIVLTGSDGTVDNVNFEAGTGIILADQGTNTVQIQAVGSGSGITNTLPVWTDGFNGTLGDSIVKEAVAPAGGAYSTTRKLTVDGVIVQSNMSDSVAIGAFALDSATNPSSGTGENIALGYNALTSLTTGTNNVAIGVNTLGNSITGKNNIAIGKKALEVVTTDNNIALGFNALNVANVQENNVVIGSTNLQNTVCTSVNNNVVVGKGAGNSNTLSGPMHHNVIIGPQAFQTSTASSVSDCIFLGQNAGKSLKGIGSSDIGIGKSAFLGTNSGFTSGGDNIAIGEGAQGANTTTTSNSICIGKGEARTDAICISTFKSGLANTASGTHSAIIGGYDNTVANDVGFIGGGHSNTITSAAKGGAILGGYNNNVTSTGNAGIALGSDLEVAGTNQIVVGRFNASNTNSRFMVGVGTSTGDRKNGFEVLQGAQARGQLKLAQYPSNFTTTQPVQNYDVLVIQGNGQVYKKPANGPTGLANLGAYQAATTTQIQQGSSISYGPNMPRLVKLTWNGITGTSIIRLPQAGDASSPGVVNRIAEFVTDSSFPATAEIEFSVSNSGTINGNTTKTITGSYKTIKFWSDGSEWFILNEQ